MGTGIGRHAAFNTPHGRAARLREALSGYGSFLAAARRADPLPALRDLACDWLRAEEVEILVPAGTSPLTSEEPNRLCGPVMIGRRVIGRIEARRNRPFEEDDRALLGALGQIIGAALEYSSLQCQLDERMGEMQAHANTLDQLLVFGRSVLHGPVEPLALAGQIAVNAPAMVGGERASVLLLSREDRQRPVLVLSNGEAATSERAREVAEYGLAGLVLREQAPMIIDETDTDRRWLGLRLSHGDSRTRCAMATPILWGERAVGALTVTSSSRFSTTQLNLLELVACHLSLALHATTVDARLAAASVSLAAMADGLEAALAVARQGDPGALDTIARVAERLRAEHVSLGAALPGGLL